MSESAFGPVEFLVIGFPGERADPGVVAAFTDVVSSGTVTVLDLVFLSKNDDGELRAVEIDEAADFGFGTVDIRVTGLASSEDLDFAAQDLEPGNSAAVLVIEHTWASTFMSAVRAAGGAVLVDERIPAAVVNEIADAVPDED